MEIGIKESKTEIRTRMLNFRNENQPSIPLNVLEESLSKINFSEIKMAMAFLSILSKNEINTKEIISFFWKLKLQVAVPIVTETSLRLAQITSATPLKTGTFQVPEPENPVFLNTKPDIIIAPLLAFNADGYRIGYGKGFYDRYLSSLSNNPLVIGIGNNFMETNFTPEDFDFPMHGIITETGLRIFNQHPLIKND